MQPVARYVPLHAKVRAHTPFSGTVTLSSGIGRRGPNRVPATRRRLRAIAKRDDNDDGKSALRAISTYVQ